MSSSPREIYNPITRVYVPKNSKAGRILDNPQNERCPGQKVINPRTRRCVDPHSKTIAQMLRDPAPASPGFTRSSPGASPASPRQKTQKLSDKLEPILDHWRYHANAQVFPPKAKVYWPAPDSRAKMYSNALIAVLKLLKIWESSRFASDASLRKAEPHFRVFQDFIMSYLKNKSTPKYILDAFYAIERVQYESVELQPQHFEVVFRFLLEKWLLIPHTTGKRVVDNENIPGRKRIVQDDKMDPQTAHRLAWYSFV